ncbi:shikimate kinase [Candidatus Formimonas warabiya]|uniref:Shikimate kinase n=1 Tax=Formimonas warabiya TaxID=1761012 RepID=A0A3G1KNG3_FORW1|nr:shikimate kinase [Candidatus Formimonas warabiya]ATW24004.1 hypothetical protein DCMF_03640 [Candidatus Formimonas warabiya]
MQNVVLIGLMGTGKSAVGRVVARLLHYEFVDTDQMVEEVTGLPIKEIFRKYGETRFRSEEALAISKIADKENMVIATGGGALIGPRNVELLKRKGYFVLLTADPEVIFERVSRKNNRPLLARGRNLEYIKQLLQDRGPCYSQCADLIIDTSRLDIADAAEKIVHMAREEGLHEKS